VATLDFRLEHDLNRYAGHHHFLDTLAKHVAESQVEVAVAVVVVIAAGLLLRRPNLWVGGLAALGGAALGLLGNVIVSDLWFRDRPFVAHPGVVHLIVHHPADASFPSDHSAALAGIAVGLFAFVRWLGVVGIVWALAVGLARVYVGEHYPGDVLGGYALGIVGGLIAVAIARLILERRVPLPGYLDRVLPRAGRGAMMSSHR
jgi:undecaprenyl-diphosphatase